MSVELATVLLTEKVSVTEPKYFEGGIELSGYVAEVVLLPELVAEVVLLSGLLTEVVLLSGLVAEVVLLSGLVTEEV